jgi:ElaB/YqjD/DUF883 family membrane-anchored ribosome-binding protein
MADNDDTAPARAAASNGAAGTHSSRSSTASRARGAAATARRRLANAGEDVAEAIEPDAHTLEEQVAQLRTDMRSIANTLTRMGQTGASELKSQARAQADDLTSRGQSALDYAQDEFGAFEKQIKDTIREKPLTAVAGAVALGFILAVITR